MQDRWLAEDAGQRDWEIVKLRYGEIEKMDRKIKILIALPFLLIIVNFIISMKLINFKPSLTPDEMRLVGFLPERLEIPERQLITVSKDLKSPVEIVKAPPKGFPPVPLSDVAPQKAEVGKPPELKVSMIVVSEKQRMAIVSGLVVKEGDGIDRIRITKIEKNRILLEEIGPPHIDKEKRTRWIYLEGIK